MAKRFSSTEIWEEDWFLDLPNEYKLYWYYMLSSCDHSGLFKVNLRSFCGLLVVSVTSSSALTYFNSGKDRIRVINEGLWLIEDFFVFQYGPNFNINNPLHKGIFTLYNKHNIELTSIRGLKEVNLTLKDKDKEIQKRGYGGKTKTLQKGEKFDDEKKNVIFPDGKKQPLGNDQLFQAVRNELRPSHITEGLIY